MKKNKEQLMNEAVEAYAEDSERERNVMQIYVDDNNEVSFYFNGEISVLAQALIKTAQSVQEFRDVLSEAHKQLKHRYGSSEHQN